MTRVELLNRAQELTCKVREAEYGSPENSFSQIAEFWNAYIEQIIFPLEAQDVAAMMILLKVARQITGNGKLDNWVDIAGYAACAAEFENGNQTNREANIMEVERQ